jgi:hypothetical protein
MNGDGLAGLANLDRHAVVLDEQADLLGEIVPEQIRPRHTRLMHTRPCDEAVGKTRVEPRVGCRRHPDERIAGAHVRRESLSVEIGLETIAKKLGVAIVDLFESGHRRIGIGEGLGGNRGRRLDHRCGTHVVERRLCRRTEVDPE